MQHRNDETLSPDQQKIYNHVISHALTDTTTVIKGYAGTGKTVTLSQCIKGLTDNGVVQVLAPTAAALSVLRKKLINLPNLSISTVASVVSMPVERIFIDNAQTNIEFDISGEGIRKFHNFLKNLNVDSDGLITATHKTTRREFDVNPATTTAGELSNCSFVVDTDELDRRIINSPTFGGHRRKAAPLIGWQQQTMSTLRTGEDCASLIKARHQREFGKGCPTSAIVVDEFSMTGDQEAQIISDAASELRAPLIVCGDPGQLQPVKKTINTLITTPAGESTGGDGRPITTFVLTDILRSTDRIAQIANDVRQGKKIKNMAYSADYPDVHTTDAVTSLDLVSENKELFMNADVAVSLRNTSVNSLNDEIRKLNGHDGPVQRGDKLVCSKTVHHLGGVYPNGSMYEVVRVNEGELFESIRDTVMAQHQSFGSVNSTAKLIYDWFERGYLCVADMVVHGGGTTSAIMLSHPGMRCPTKQIKSIENFIIDNKAFPVPIIPCKFAYAVTVHKAQGSEWEHVVFVTNEADLTMGGDTTYLPYTALTRAKEKITVLYTRHVV